MVCRALAGQTYATSPETIYDADDWDDRAYIDQIKQNAQTADNTLNWVRPNCSIGYVATESRNSTTASGCVLCTALVSMTLL